MAQLDIAEKRVPQDGRIKLNLSKTKRDRLPRQHAADAVRREDRAAYPRRLAAKLGIDKLGYEADQKKLFLDAIHKPYGMVLVTGPTGSGKTVSLYTGAEHPQHRRAQHLDGRGSGRNPRRRASTRCR